jgi:hypothetical protein
VIDRATCRTIICAELARHEHWYRTQAAGLARTVEADAMQLLSRGVGTDPNATQEEREEAARLAWQRVDAGRTRAAALRTLSRALRRMLGVFGGDPVRDKDAPPETRRQARVAMWEEEREARAALEGGQAPAQRPGDLTKAWLVQHADAVAMPFEHVPGCDGKRRPDIVCPACYEEPTNAP